MSLSNASGTCIIPTLSRLVLCAAFLPAGWGKVMQTTEFSGDDAQRLIELGVIEEAPTQANIGQSRSIIPASWQDDTETSEPAPAVTQDPRPPAEEDTPAAGSPADTAAGTYKARKLHHVTLMLDEKGLPAPRWLALLAAWTELIGGGLILVGLFSRVWGLGLAITMCTAFYVTSLPALLGVGNLFTGLFNLPMDAFNGMFAQLGLFVLAFGVFLTGAGPISLDRALFRKSDDDDDEDDEEI